MKSEFAMESKFLTAVTATLILASCCPQIVPQLSHRTDSVRTVTHTEYIEKWCDTTIFVDLPVEVREQVRRDSSHLETNMATSDAWIEEGLLRHTLANKKTAIPASIKLKNIESRERNDSVIYRDVYIKEVVEQKHIPKSYWLFMTVSIVAILWVIIKTVNKIRGLI